MANLAEQSLWENGIYQIEESDPVQGGANGVTNRPTKQLANRTLWLKNELARQIELVNSAKLGKTDNAVSASKFATVRNIAMTGDGSWNVNFDGTQNASATMTLANTGVTAGSYNSVTVDAKGRVTAGLTQTHGLVTATTTTGIANTVTTNNNTYLNIVASGVGRASSVGSSTQITGTNGISVSSDTAGALTLSGTRATDTAAGVTMLSHNTNGTDKTKAVSEFALGEVRRMANQAQVTADGIALTWSNVQNKPTTFTPSEHTHNDKANLSGDNFTGKITAPYLELGALGNIPYPSISFKSNRTGSKYWSAEPSLQEFHVISRSSNGVQNGQIVYKFINRASGIYTVATTEDNVASATKLATPRTINGVAFDGTQNIVVSDDTKAPTQHTHSTADFTDFTVQDLLNTANLNDIRAVGFYGQNTNALATAERNYPEQWAGYLIVAPSADGVQQEYTTYYHNNKYVRSFYQNNWLPWKRIDGADWATLRDKPTTYPPSTHAHDWNSITGKPATYPPSTHTHNDKANLSGDNFTGKITAPYLELGALGNIPYPSISFKSNRTGSKYWSAEPNLQEFYILSRTADGVTNGQVGYKFINRASGIYTVATTEDNVASASKLQTARNIALTGAVTGSVSFDGSQNVSISTQQTVHRVQKSMQIPTTHNFNNTPNVTVTGSVETCADGRVVQYFTMICSINNFFRHNAAQLYRDAGFTVNYFGEGGAAFLELPLWTAMPSKVQRAIINIAAVENNYIHEALEWVWNWESLWNTSKNIRDKCYFGFRRISGERDEKVQIHITVEGY